MKILGIAVLMSVAMWANSEEPELSIDGAVEMNITTLISRINIGSDQTKTQMVIGLGLLEKS